jgi:hypothetical protein
LNPPKGRRVVEIPSAAVRIQGEFAWVDAEYLDSQLLRTSLTNDDAKIFEELQRNWRSPLPGQDDYAGDVASFMQGFTTALVMAKRIDDFRNQRLLDAVIGAVT